MSGRFYVWFWFHYLSFSQQPNSGIAVGNRVLLIHSWVIVICSMQTETEDLKKQLNKLNLSVGYSIFSGYNVELLAAFCVCLNVSYLPTEISTQDLAHINMWKFEERSQYHNSAHPRFFFCFQTPGPARGHRRKLTTLSSVEWLLWSCLPSCVHSLFSVDTSPDTKVTHRQCNHTWSWTHLEVGVCLVASGAQ